MSDKEIEKMARSFLGTKCIKHQHLDSKTLVSDFKNLMSRLGVDIASIKPKSS